MIGAISAIAGFLPGADPLNPAQFKLFVAGKEIEFKNSFVLNPTELTIDRKNTWQNQRAGGGDSKDQGATALTYASGEDTMNFTFILDASENPKKDLIDDLLALYQVSAILEYDKAKLQSKEFRPPVAVIQWGSFNFTGVVESLNMKVTLFDHNALFKRATISMALKGSAFVDKQVGYLDSAPPPPAKGKESKGAGGLLGGLF